MILLASFTTSWLIAALVLPVSGLVALTARSIVKSRRTVRRFEQEIGIYDRAFEIYSRPSRATATGVRRSVSDDLVLVAALNACGALDDHEYGEAKARIIDGTGGPWPSAPRNGTGSESLAGGTSPRLAGPAPAAPRLHRSPTGFVPTCNRRRPVDQTSHRWQRPGQTGHRAQGLGSLGKRWR